MSTQKSVIDALITALESVSGVNKVTKDVDVWNQSNPQDYGTLYIVPRKPENDMLAYRHTTSPDMMAHMEIEIQGNIREKYSEDVDTNLDTLMKNVEIAVNSNTALNALVNDIYLEEDEFMKSENYGLFSALYVVDYFYNHLSP